MPDSEPLAQAAPSLAWVGVVHLWRAGESYHDDKYQIAAARVLAGSFRSAPLDQLLLELQNPCRNPY